MSKQKQRNKQRNIVILVVVLVVGAFLIFGKNSPMKEYFQTDEPFFVQLNNGLNNLFGLDKEKEILTTTLENPITSVHMIDVGQGESILIRTPEGDILIDGGEVTEEDKVVDYLQGLDIKRLELVIATHPHSDHIGGLAKVIRTMDVGQVLVPEIPDKLIPSSRTFTNFLDAVASKGYHLTTAAIGSTYSFGDDIILTILAPPEKGVESTNNLSIVTKLESGNVSFLFTGDAENWSEREMLRSGNNLKADVLNAGHHGSKTSSTAKFVEAVSPQIVLISCGVDNSYGHPNNEVLARFHKINAEVYRTDTDGTVVVETDGNVLAVVTENHRRGENVA